MSLDCSWLLQKWEEHANSCCNFVEWSNYLETLVWSYRVCIWVNTLICDETNKPQIYAEHFKLCALVPTSDWKKILIGKFHKHSRSYHFQYRYFSHSLNRAPGSLSFNGVKWFLCSCVCGCAHLRKAYKHVDKVLRSFDLNQSISFLYSLNRIPSLSYEREANSVRHERIDSDGNKIE